MSIIVSILCLAVVVLFVLNRSMAGRLEALERRVGAVPAAAAVPSSSRGAVTGDPSQVPVGDLESAPAPRLPGTPPLPARPTFANRFESLVGGRLLIWVGGVALVVAAMFLIRYSIEVGLITPALRMIGATAFGLALLALGEWARASGRLTDDPRVAMALVGAGLAVLYLTVYGSHTLYGFLGVTVASVLMVAVTAAALGLSLRHGVGTAAMGLIGGFITPLLVGDPDGGALPLVLYLALLDAAVFFVAWRRGWGWLAGLAVLAGMMLATRFTHFGSASLFPDASLAVFMLAGFYLRRAIYLVPLLLLAGAIDYAATQHMGVSEYCLSPAYPFLIPAYAALWFGGRWYAARHSLQAASLAPLTAAVLISVSMAFVITEASFYLFSGRYPDLDWMQYARLSSTFYLLYMGSAIFYIAITALAHVFLTANESDMRGRSAIK